MRLRTRFPSTGSSLPIACAAWLLIALWSPTADSARTTKLENGLAVFAALDKVTARISEIKIPLGQAARFRALTITPRACYTRPPDEAPWTTGFVEIEEKMLDNSVRRIFTGWMFAESPGLNAMEHSVFDVWLTGCEAPLAASGKGRSSERDPVAPRRPRPRR